MDLYIINITNKIQLLILILNNIYFNINNQRNKFRSYPNSPLLTRSCNIK